MSLKGAFLGPCAVTSGGWHVCGWLVAFGPGGVAEVGAAPSPAVPVGLYPRVGETMPKWGKILKSLKEIVVYESVNEAGITSANITQRSRSPGWPELPRGCSEPRGRLVVPAWSPDLQLFIHRNSRKSNPQSHSGGMAPPGRY